MKRWPLLLLVLSMLIAISACGEPVDEKTAISTTEVSTTEAPAIEVSTTEAPTTETPTTEAPTTETPTTEAPTTETPTTEAPTTEAPTTETPTTEIPTTEVTTTEGSTTDDPLTEPPITGPPSNEVLIESVDFVQFPSSLTIGDSYELSVNIIPSNATEKLTWSTSDPSIATVNDGVITAKGKGTVNITAHTQNAGTFSISVWIHEPVTSIVFDQPTYEVWRGHTATIGITITPEDSPYWFSWTSSDPDIARVNNGEVYGVKNGTAIITVTAENGGYSAQCSVTVVDAPVTLECNLSYSYFIGDWDGFHASVVVNGGSANYSDYIFNITVYLDDINGDHRVLHSKENIEGNSFNNGWLATTEFALRDIPNPHKGVYTAIFEVIDPYGNAYSETATYSTDSWE